MTHQGGNCHQPLHCSGVPGAFPPGDGRCTGVFIYAELSGLEPDAAAREVECACDGVFRWLFVMSFVDKLEQHLTAYQGG